MSSDRKNDLVWGPVRLPICPPTDREFPPGHPNEGDPVRYWWYDTEDWVPLTETLWNTRLGTGSYQLEFTQDEMIFLVEQMTGKNAYARFYTDTPRELGFDSLQIGGRYKGGRCRWPWDPNHSYAWSQEVENETEGNKWVWEWPPRASVAGVLLSDTVLAEAFDNLYDASELVLTWDNGNAQNDPDFPVKLDGSTSVTVMDLFIAFLESFLGSEIVRVTGFRQDPDDAHPNGKIIFEDFSDLDIVFDLDAQRPATPAFLQDTKTYQHGLNSIGFNGPDGVFRLGVSGEGYGYFARKSTVESIQSDLDNFEGSPVSDLVDHLNAARDHLLSLHSARLTGGEGYIGEHLFNNTHEPIWTAQEINDVIDGDVLTEIFARPAMFDPPGSGDITWTIGDGETNVSLSTFDSGNEITYVLPESWILTEVPFSEYFNFRVAFDDILYDAQEKKYRLYFSMQWLIVEFYERFLDSQQGGAPASFAKGSVGSTYPMTATTAPRPPDHDGGNPTASNQEYFTGSDSTGSPNRIYPFGDANAFIAEPFPSPLREKYVQFVVFDFNEGGTELSKDGFTYGPCFFFAEELPGGL